MNASNVRQRAQDERQTLVAVRDSLLILLVEDTDVRGKCEDGIRDLRDGHRASPALEPYLQRVVVARDERRVIDKLESHLEGDSLSAAIVLSDGFASPATNELSPRPQTTRLGEEIRRRFGDDLLGMIAVTDWAPVRVPDIDRVVSPQLTPDELAQSLELTVRTLEYKAPPNPNSGSLTLPVTVRRVGRQVELCDYFKLRHEVYSTMGYLDAELEASPTKIEADLCDLSSIHICAIEKPRRVVGTARLILAEDEDGKLRNWSERIAKVDPVLRHRFRPPYPHLQLPVWQSQEVQKKIAQMYTSEELHGEISRVVVAASHRGRGLARLLVNYAIHEAKERGLTRLFLECVPLHRPLYRNFGFVELPGRYERVVNVDRTVVAMELNVSDEPAKVGSLPVLGNTILAEQNCLCACDKRECYSKEYSIYKTEDCPLHYRPGQPR